MEKKIKKKMRVRLLPILIFLIVCAILFMIIKLILEYPIQNIIITGNSYLIDQEIIELVEIQEYPSFVGTYFSSLEKKLKKSPWIQDVKISRHLWGIIEIEIEEAEPLFEKIENGVVVLSNGNEISSTDLEIPVTGLLNYVPDTKYETLLKQMIRIEKSIRYLISEMTYFPNEQDKDRFLLYMNDGNYVYLTLTKFQNINYYEQVLEQLDGKKGILYLDSGNHFQIMEEDTSNIQ